jgi:hypothetical protein
MAHAHLQQLPPQPDQHAERRAHPRLDARLDAVLYLDGRTQSVVIHNVSRGGLKLEHALGLAKGDDITIDLLNHRSLSATVMWAGFPYTGVAFDQQLPENDPLLFGSARP